MRVLVGKFRRGAVNRQDFFRFHRAGVIDRFAEQIQNATERAGTDRHHDFAAGVFHDGAAHEAVGGVHRDGAHDVVTQMLSHFEREVVGLVIDGRIADFQRGENRRDAPGGKFDVDDGAGDLADFAWRGAGGCGHVVSSRSSGPRPRR